LAPFLPRLPLHAIGFICRQDGINFLSGHYLPSIGWNVVFVFHEELALAPHVYERHFDGESVEIIYERAVSELVCCDAARDLRAVSVLDLIKRFADSSESRARTKGAKNHNGEEHFQFIASAISLYSDPPLVLKGQFWFSL
jgi:hypothetical protein